MDSSKNQYCSDCLAKGRSKFIAESHTKDQCYYLLSKRRNASHRNVDLMPRPDGCIECWIKRRPMTIIKSHKKYGADGAIECRFVAKERFSRLQKNRAAGEVTGEKQVSDKLKKTKSGPITYNENVKDLLVKSKSEHSDLPVKRELKDRPHIRLSPIKNRPIVKMDQQIDSRDNCRGMIPEVKPKLYPIGSRKNSNVPILTKKRNEATGLNKIQKKPNDISQEKTILIESGSNRDALPMISRDRHEATGSVQRKTNDKSQATLKPIGSGSNIETLPMLSRSKHEATAQTKRVTTDRSDIKLNPTGSGTNSTLAPNLIKNTNEATGCIKRVSKGRPKTKFRPINYETDTNESKLMPESRRKEPTFRWSKLFTKNVEIDVLTETDLETSVSGKEPKNSWPKLAPITTNKPTTGIGYIDQENNDKPKQRSKKTNKPVLGCCECQAKGRPAYIFQSHKKYRLDGSIECQFLLREKKQISTNVAETSCHKATEDGTFIGTDYCSYCAEKNRPKNITHSHTMYTEDGTIKCPYFIDDNGQCDTPLPAWSTNE